MSNPCVCKLILLLLWNKQFIASRGDHGDEGNELFEVDLQISVLVEVSEEFIQSVILLDFLFSRKIALMFIISSKWTVYLITLINL